eukprot:7387038-Prymnesium_polylepis.2
MATWGGHPQGYGKSNSSAPGLSWKTSPCGMFSHRPGGAGSVAPAAVRSRVVLKERLVPQMNGPAINLHKVCGEVGRGVAESLNCSHYLQRASTHAGAVAGKVGPLDVNRGIAIDKHCATSLRLAIRDAALDQGQACSVYLQRTRSVATNGGPDELHLSVGDRERSFLAL